MLSFRSPEMPQIPNEAEFLCSWNSIFAPSWTRSLKFHTHWGGDHTQSSWETLFSQTAPGSREIVERLKRDPIGPPLPPYPSKVKKVCRAKQYMDMEGKLQRRELLPPMIRLPEFSTDMWQT